MLPVGEIDRRGDFERLLHGEITSGEYARRLKLSVSGGCPTGKRIYWKQHLANRAITEAAKRGELAPMRHYLCPDCGRWHLSRKDRSKD